MCGPLVPDPRIRDGVGRRVWDPAPMTMTEPNTLPLAALRPGGMFLSLLAALIALGLLAHALLLRRFGTEQLDRWTRRTEGILFSIFLAAMLGFSSLQVVLRNLFHSGLLWLDPLTRTLVLWVAFLGALVATSHGRHLHVDAVHRVVPRRFVLPIDRGLAVVAAACCGLLANGAYIYLRDEYQHGLSPFLGVPSWATQSILLIGFGLLCYRFLVRAIWPERPAGAA